MMFGMSVRYNYTNRRAQGVSRFKMASKLYDGKRSYGQMFHLNFNIFEIKIKKRMEDFKINVRFYKFLFRFNMAAIYIT